MSNEKVLSDEEKSIADSIQSSLERVRAPVGDLVTSLGKQGEHPMSLALALAGAAATVVASLMAASGQPRHIAKITMASLFEESQKFGMDALTMMVEAQKVKAAPETAAAVVSQEEKQEVAA